MIVLDTHTLVWWVSSPTRLSPRARRTIARAARKGPLAFSAISLFEIVTAVRRGRLELGIPLDRWVADLLQLPELQAEPVSAAIAQSAGGLPEAISGDPADRIIAATALALDATLVTADQRLRRAPGLRSIW